MDRPPRTLPFHAGSESMLRYSIPSERAADNAILRSEFNSAEALLDDLIAQLTHENDEEPFNPELFHAHLKKIALPMYRRAEYDAGQPIQFEQERDISSMYGDVVELLALIKQQYDDATIYTFSRAYERGALSEATVFALFARRLTGEPDDRFTVLPSSRYDDIGTIDEDGNRTSVDFMILDRIHLGAIPIQVKTTRSGAQQNSYAQGIMMLNVEHIAGGKEHIGPLQDAFIAEVNGIITDDQTHLIESAEGRLYSKVEKRLAKLASRAPTA